jgi:Protein of unknown function (DUF3500)
LIMSDLNQTAGVFRDPTRPLHTKGGSPGYLEKSLAAAAEPFKGITTAGTVIPGLFSIQKTGVSTLPIKAAAEDFLDSLSPEQRAKTLFAVDTAEWRKWSNIHPTLMRHGMPLFEMSDTQRDRAFSLLRQSLSTEGFQTARDVMRLNETVMEMTGRFAEYGEDLYWMSIMGKPSTSDPWGWQIDGHHLIINYFVLGDQVVMTPTFRLGAGSCQKRQIRGHEGLQGGRGSGIGGDPRAFRRAASKSDYRARTVRRSIHLSLSRQPGAELRGHSIRRSVKPAT